jgi:hypothetical protein
MTNRRNISRRLKIAAIAPLAAAVFATGTIAAIAPGAQASTDQAPQATAPPRSRRSLRRSLRSMWATRRTPH